MGACWSHRLVGIELRWYGSGQDLGLCNGEVPKLEPQRCTWAFLKKTSFFCDSAWGFVYYRARLCNWIYIVEKYVKVVKGNMWKNRVSVGASFGGSNCNKVNPKNADISLHGEKREKNKTKIFVWGPKAIECRDYIRPFKRCILDTKTQETPLWNAKKHQRSQKTKVHLPSPHGNHPSHRGGYLEQRELAASGSGQEPLSALWGRLGSLGGACWWGGPLGGVWRREGA